MKLKEKLREIFEDRFTGILYITLFIFTVLLLATIFTRFFQRDEIEHIHSSWYAANRYLPYVDFFQTHHPLLWFILAPFIMIFGNTTAVLFFGRALMLLSIFGSARLIYCTGRLITGRKQLSLLASVLLLTSLTFAQRGIEIRPETPQVFFALLFFYYLMVFLHRNASISQPGPVENEVESNGASGNRLTFLSGLFASIAFLFLQKVIFFVVISLVLLFYLFYKRRITIKPVVYFISGFVGPLLILAAYLFATHSWHDYILTCWKVPLAILYSFSPHHTIIGLLIENTLFWFLAGAGLIAIFSPKNKMVNRELRLLTLMALLVLLFCIFGLRMPNKENFMLPIALCAVPAAYAFGELSTKFDLKLKGKIGLLTASVLLPFVILLQLMSLGNADQLEQYRFVLNNTTPTDVVYDGENEFNLFRKDIHYFWYGLEPNMEFATYNHVTGNEKYGDYDILENIINEKPKFIANAQIKITSKGLHRFYKETIYKGLYIRR